MSTKWPSADKTINRNMPVTDLSLLYIQFFHIGDQ